MPPYSRAGQMTGAQFRAIREEELHLSPTALARLMDCQPQTIWNIESNEGRKPSRLMTRLLLLLCDPEIRAGAMLLADREAG